MLAQNYIRTIQRSATSGRSPYRTPRLCCYGDVGVITQGVSGMNNSDGAAMGPSKTS